MLSTVHVTIHALASDKLTAIMLPCWLNTWQVIADDSLGLLFRNKRDRKVMNVDPKAVPGDNSTRTQLETVEIHPSFRLV